VCGGLYDEVANAALGSPGLLRRSGGEIYPVPARQLHNWRKGPSGETLAAQAEGFD